MGCDYLNSKYFNINITKKKPVPRTNSFIGIELKSLRLISVLWSLLSTQPHMTFPYVSVPSSMTHAERYWPLFGPVLIHIIHNAHSLSLYLSCSFGVFSELCHHRPVNNYAHTRQSIFIACAQKSPGTFPLNSVLWVCVWLLRFDALDSDAPPREWVEKGDIWWAISKRETPIKCAYTIIHTFYCTRPKRPESMAEQRTNHIYTCQVPHCPADKEHNTICSTTLWVEAGKIHIRIVCLCVSVGSE